MDSTPTIETTVVSVEDTEINDIVKHVDMPEITIINSKEIEEDEDDLYASPEDIQKLTEEGALQSHNSTWDRSYLHFRVIEFKEKESINWKFPLTAAEKTAGTVEFELNPYKYTVVAYRGIPLEFQYGNKFNVKTAESDSVTICETIGSSENLVSNTVKTDGSLPLREPLPRVWFSKKEPTKPHFFFGNNPNLTINAVKTDLVTGKKTDTDCLSCVHRMEYILGDPATTEQKCRPQGNLLFAVYEVGLLDNDAINAHIDDPINTPLKVKWVSIPTLEIKQKDGTLLDRPFIIRIKGLGASQQSSFGEGPNDIPMRFPSSIPANAPKISFLPDDNLFSLGDYHKWLTDYKATSEDRCRLSKIGKKIFTTVTEIYVAPLTKETNSKKVTLAFRPIASGVNTEYNGRKIGDLVKEARQVRKFEEAIFNKETIDLKVAALPEHTSEVAAPAATVAPATTLATEAYTTTSDSQTADEKLKEKMLGAYSRKKPS